ncbi:MAG: two-component regulator propeller domain-containing protein, partial [Saprospiraceae bacterium]
NDGIIDLTEARGRFWISTANGLFIYTPRKPAYQFLPGNFTKLFVDSKGFLFAGTLQKYLYKIDPRKPQVIAKFSKQYEAYSSTQPVGLQNTCFAEDSQGKIWVGSKNGLNRYDPVKNTWRQFYSNPRIANTLSNSVINDLHLDLKGNLWIATNKGVNLLNEKELKKPIEDTLLHFISYQYINSDNNSIGNNRVRKIFEDSRGWLWFGTDIGVDRYDIAGQWQRFFKEDGLPGNKISGILEDNKGNIWVSTANNGLSKYEIREKHFINFSKRDGLRTDQFTSGACYKMADGKLIFAGFKGCVCLDPDKIVSRPNARPLYFTEIRLFNRPVTIGDVDGLLVQPLYTANQLELAYNQNVLSLQFAALDFTNPEKQVYRYRLEGFNSLESWQYLGTNREITFTNLYPGTYKLRVESTTGPGHNQNWESASELMVKVKMPWLVILMYTGIILGFLYVFYRLRLNRKLAVAEVRRLEEIDAFKTRFYTNITHEFRTPLTIVLGVAEQLNAQASEGLKAGLNMIRRNGQQLLLLVNQMLDLAKAESGQLKLYFVQGNVVNYLKVLLESFQSLAAGKNIGLRFHSELEEIIMDYDPERLRSVVSNLLSNAVKFTPIDGEVYLRIRQIVPNNLPKLEIAVVNTGPGIQ